MSAQFKPFDPNGRDDRHGSTERAGRPALRVLPMAPDDVADVIQIEQAIYPFPWTEGNFHDSLRAGYDARLFRIDKTLIGYALLMQLPDEIHLLNLSIAAAYQGQGWGRQALDWLCRDWRARGGAAILLEVRPSNLAAVALYESAAFVTIGQRKRYYPSFQNTREDALVMRKMLTHG